MSEKLTRRSALAASLAGFGVLATTALTAAGDKKRRQQCCCPQEQPNAQSVTIMNEDVRVCRIFMFASFGNGIYGYYAIRCKTMAPEPWYGPAAPYGEFCSTNPSTSCEPNAAKGYLSGANGKAKRKVRIEKANPMAEDEPVDVDLFNGATQIRNKPWVRIKVTNSNGRDTTTIEARLAKYSIPIPNTANSILAYFGEEIIRPTGMGMPPGEIQGTRDGDYAVKCVNDNEEYLVITATKIP